MWIFFAVGVLMLMTYLFWREVLAGRYDPTYWDVDGDDESGRKDISDGDDLRNIGSKERRDRKKDLGRFRLLPGKSEFAPFEGDSQSNARTSRRRNR